MRLHFRAESVAVLIFVAACAMNPQQGNRATSGRRPSAVRAGCLDTLRAADTISTIVKMTVASQDPKVSLPPDFEDMLVQEFRRQFRLPPRLALSVVKGSEPCDSLGSRCVGGVLDVGAVAYATAHSDGKFTDIQVLDVALTPQFADSVSSALRVMSREQVGPPTGDADSIPILMQIIPDEAPDTVPTVRQVFKARVPTYHWPFRYATMPAAGVDAKYPFAARLAGVEDSVTLAFTVDADGNIAAESIELVSANYRDFVSSVLEALTRTRYHPAHLGDCPVPTRMKQRFLFKVPE